MRPSRKSTGFFRIIKIIYPVFDSEIEKSHIDIFDTTLKDFFVMLVSLFYSFGYFVSMYLFAYEIERFCQ